MEHDQNLLSVLFQKNCFEEISNLIWKKKIYNWNFTKEHFKFIIEQEQIDLILYFVKIRDCRVILEDYGIQNRIVNKYMKYGSKIYYGAEMLIYVYKLNWNNDLTKDLCKNIIRTIKTKDILNCHSPILTCLLISEFLNQIGGVSVQHTSRCEKVQNELMQFCLNIQEANPDENYIKYLMTQKDSRDRSSLQIASENSFYRVLQTAEIGTIVKKMWNGFISNNKFFAASSMHRYLESSSNLNDPFNGFENLDITKNYFYQLAVWTSSCSLRYWPESASTLVLIAVYNLFIYFLVKRGQTLNTFYNLDQDLQYLLIFFIVWVICINLNIINLIIFGMKSNRKFSLDGMGWLEISMLFSACALLLDAKKIQHEYIHNDISNVLQNLYDELIIPISRNFGIQISDFYGNSGFLFRVILLSINDILVWMRITGILLTFKDIGPLIRMIYLMTILLLKNLIIFALYITCCAAIFTAVFNKHSIQFRDFSTTIMSLLGGFMNSFDTNGFDDGNYKIFGAISFVTYMCISGVLLINLLIALLSNVYESLSLLVDASHRSVLITFYRKYRWDEENGYMIFLTTPLNVINFFVFPFSYLFANGENKKKFNIYVCRIYYLIFYFPIILLVFISYSILLIPLCYLKGIIYEIGNQINIKISKYIKFVKILKWIFFGAFYLGFIYLRDIIFVLKTIFFISSSKQNVTNRIKNYIQPDDVVIFLKFIHSRKINEPIDIHSLFRDYLIFEQKKKSENDDKLKDKAKYLTVLHSSVKNLQEKSMNSKISSIITLNNKNEKFGSRISSNYIKKNLIVIEILENFLIDEGQNSGTIDIDKLKMLLPKSMNIDNAYIKRLLHTDITSLKKAVNQLRSKKNLFLQYQLLNKIVLSAIRLDKEIDSGIKKNLRLLKSNSIITEDEKDIENNNNQQRRDSNEDINPIEHSKEVLKLVNNLITEFNQILGNKKDINILN